MEEIIQNPILNKFLEKYDERDWNEIILKLCLISLGYLNSNYPKELYSFNELDEILLNFQNINTQIPSPTQLTIPNIMGNSMKKSTNQNYDENYDPNNRTPYFKTNEENPLINTNININNRNYPSQNIENNVNNNNINDNINNDIDNNYIENIKDNSNDDIINNYIIDNEKDPLNNPEYENIGNSNDETSPSLEYLSQSNEYTFPVPCYKIYYCNICCCNPCCCKRIYYNSNINTSNNYQSNYNMSSSELNNNRYSIRKPCPDCH